MFKVIMKVTLFDGQELDSELSPAFDTIEECRPVIERYLNNLEHNGYIFQYSEKLAVRKDQIKYLTYDYREEKNGTD